MTVKQQYRMTFRCSDHGDFKRITTDPELKTAACPDCVKAKRSKAKITKRQFIIGDGHVSVEEAQNTIAPKAFDVKNYPNVIYKCNSCFAITKVHQEVGEANMTECPACDAKGLVYKGHISRDISTASKTLNKCVDKTADIVMEDYGMGNLKSTVKPGEAMAPRLEPKRQAAADGMFSGPRRKSAGINTAALAKRAMTGGMRDMRADPVKMLHHSEGRGRTQ